MEKKIYTAFVSSAFQSLRDERNITINSLLDFRIMPVGMEHFTVSTNGEFSDIEEIIDDADLFIMLMGSTYGSCDENGVSWTEREYLYAVQKNKPMIVIICQKLADNRQKPISALTEDERKQVEFSNRIAFARTVSEEFDIQTIIVQFINTCDLSKCVGWTRHAEPTLNEEALALWREAHRVFSLAGLWYHVHLSDDDESYMRAGTVRIEQDFTPNHYQELHMDGVNYGVEYYDTQAGTLRENRMKCSRFVGEYKLQDNGEIFGIFNAKRSFNGTFNTQDVNRGNRRGIHDFSIDVFAEETERIDGEFHDEAPSPKLGRLFLFRSMADRDAFLLENRSDVLEQR